MLSGDHVYKMDYARMLAVHRERGAAATIGVIEIPSEEASRFGVMQVDDQDRSVGFLEKPKNLAPGGQVLASMGIYIFDMKHSSQPSRQMRDVRPTTTSARTSSRRS